MKSFIHSNTFLLLLSFFFFFSCTKDKACTELPSGCDRNESWDCAIEINCLGQTIEDQIKEDAETDYFKVEIETAGKLTVDVTSIPSGFTALVGYVFGENLTNDIVGGSAFGGGDFSMSADVDAGTYYILFQGGLNAITNDSYAFQVTLE